MANFPQYSPPGPRQGGYRDCAVGSESGCGHVRIAKKSYGGVLGVVSADHCQNHKEQITNGPEEGFSRARSADCGIGMEDLRSDCRNVLARVSHRRWHRARIGHRDSMACDDCNRAFCDRCECR